MNINLQFKSKFQVSCSMNSKLINDIAAPSARGQTNKSLLNKGGGGRGGEGMVGLREKWRNWE